MSIPQQFGRYAVRRRIGSGGFATVWLAYDEQLDSPVAVKVLADNWSEDAHVKRRFLEEGRYLRRVESPHVVTVYDAGQLDDGRPYLVMSYADQGTLADRLEISGLSTDQALEVIRQVGAGLQALHDRDIVHRDIKPANVLFRSAEPRIRAMVGDLGLGRALDVSSRLTMVGGTPAYVAPEQARAESPDARADQYSLAALTYVLLTGRTPYDHGSLGAAGDPGPPPPLSGDGRTFPPEVEAVVHRGLAPDREDRFRTVTEYVDALAATLGAGAAVPAGAPVQLPRDPALTAPAPRPTTPRSTATGTPQPRRRSVARFAGIGALALAALGVGAGAAFVAFAEQPLQALDPRPTVEITNADGTLAVKVPREWHRAVADEQWDGYAEDARYPALSVGTSAYWADRDLAGEGAFLGVVEGTRIPAALPQHPECETGDEPVVQETVAGPVHTVVHTGCPGGVVVERVAQVAEDQLLWVQIRSADRGTAEQVLESVQVTLGS